MSVITFYDVTGAATHHRLGLKSKRHNLPLSRYMRVPEESLHSAWSTSVKVLSSFTVSESGVLSSYSTAAEYIPERRRTRTSSSPARIWSRLSTEPFALRRTMVLQRALTAPRMCPALKARKERQSSSRHLALSSFRSRFSTVQSISHSSSIGTSFRAVRLCFTVVKSPLSLFLSPLPTTGPLGTRRRRTDPAVDSPCASPLSAHQHRHDHHHHHRCNRTTS